MEDTKQNNEEYEITSTWDDLVELRKEVVKDLIEQQALVNETVKQIQHLILKDNKLSVAVKGLLSSFTDIAEKVRQNMNFHMQLDENNNIIDYKKGPINTENDEMYDYIKISSNYISAKEQISHLLATAYLEIFTLVKANDDTLVSQEDLNKITDTYVESQKELLENIKGFTNGEESSSTAHDEATEDKSNDEQ